MHKSFRMSVPRAPMPAPLCPTCVHGTHRRPASGLRSSQSALLRLPRKFPVLLAGLVRRPRQYLDPVSVSWKTSIMEAGLIRSALIAISNDGNNVEFVIPTHPSYKKKQKTQRPVQSPSVRRRCDGDEGLTWQVLWGWSGVRLWIGAEEFLRKVALLTLCTRLSCHVHLYISCTTDRSTPRHWHAWMTRMRTPQRPRV